MAGNFRKERINLRKRRQEGGESTESFAKDLQRLVESCGYTKQEEEDNLFDQFVAGLQSDTIRSKLCKAASLTFDTARKMADAMDSVLTTSKPVQEPEKRASKERVIEIEGLKARNAHFAGRRNYYDQRANPDPDDLLKFPSGMSSQGQEANIKTVVKLKDVEIEGAPSVGEENSYYNQTTKVNVNASYKINVTVQVKAKKKEIKEAFMSTDALAKVRSTIRNKYGFQDFSLFTAAMKELDEGKTFEESGVKDGDEIIAAKEENKASEVQPTNIMVRICLTEKQKTIQMQFISNAILAVARKDIAAKLDSQDFVMCDAAGKELDEEKTFVENGIKDGDVIKAGKLVESKSSMAGSTSQRA